MRGSSFSDSLKVAAHPKENLLVFETVCRLSLMGWRGGSWGHDDKRGYNRGRYQQEHPSALTPARQFRRAVDCTSKSQGGVGGEEGTRVRATNIARAYM